MARGFVDILFPPCCLGCARVLPVETFFCEACDEQVCYLPRPCCRLCAEPGAHPGEVCPRCAARPPPFSRAWAPFLHDGSIAHAIHQLKYEDHPELVPGLAALLAREAEGFLRDAPVLVAAIPLHASRLRQRRFDQAELLAGELAKRTGRTRLFALERAKATDRQVGLTEAERERNVQGAFVVASGEVAGAALLLVDDVFTTGATARAAAQALLDAGASKVEVLTLARAFSG